MVVKIPLEAYLPPDLCEWLSEQDNAAQVVEDALVTYRLNQQRTAELISTYRLPGIGNAGGGKVNR